MNVSNHMVQFRTNTFHLTTQSSSNYNSSRAATGWWAPCDNISGCLNGSVLALAAMVAGTKKSQHSSASFIT